MVHTLNTSLLSLRLYQLQHYAPKQDALPIGLHQHLLKRGMLAEMVEFAMDWYLTTYVLLEKRTAIPGATPCFIGIAALGQHVRRIHILTG